MMAVAPDTSILRPAVARAISMDPSESDGSLVARARAGDRAAVDALFRRHTAAVLRRSMRLVGRRQDAEDVAQDALAVAIDELHALRETEAFGRWLAQITVRQAHRYFRRRKLKRLLGLDRGYDDATLESLARDDASPETRAELANIDAVLRVIDGADRVAWVLRVVEGEQLEAVAALCDCSLATAKRRIAAAQERIDRALDDRKRAKTP
jgi:RNA polymerase sigma-70 factor (ECF subfamily)